MLGGVARDLIILKQRSRSNLVRSYGAEENPFSLPLPSLHFHPRCPSLSPHYPSPRHRQAEAMRNRRRV